MKEPIIGLGIVVVVVVLVFIILMFRLLFKSRELTKDEQPGPYGCNKDSFRG